MQAGPHTYHFYPLGDNAITIDFGNCIEEQTNREVLARFHQLNDTGLSCIAETVPAYSSLTVYFDIEQTRKKAGPLTAYEWIKKELEKIMMQPVQWEEPPTPLIRIPVCYDKDFGKDIQRVAIAKRLSVEEVIQIHTAVIYRVYMLGFLPGFAYMGKTDERIDVPRKPQPVNMAQGSVGLAGRQTGIYPLASPGGWQIIGRTPVKIFDAAAPDPVLLKTGDRIQFYPITKKEFEQYRSGI